LKEKPLSKTISLKAYPRYGAVDTAVFASKWSWNKKTRLIATSQVRKQLICF